MRYFLILEVLDNNGDVIEKINSIENSSNFLTVGELKLLMNNGKYKNINADSLELHGKGLQDSDLVEKPFIYYRINLL